MKILGDDVKTLTLRTLKTLLKTRFGGVLKSGNHSEDGECCVRELRACALELPWSDHPDGTEASATDRAAQILNDGVWSTDAARAEGCLPLALLSEADAPEGWVKQYALNTVKEILPLPLEAAALVIPSHADALRAAAIACRIVTDLSAARSAARSARSAARSAAEAARSAEAAEAAADSVLNKGVAILMKSQNRKEHP